MKSRKSAFGIAALAALMLGLLAVSSHGQTVGGTISGIIKDQTGAILPGVKVSIKNMATGVTRTVTTNDEGFYRAPNLLPGQYEVTASATGFATEVQKDITLTVGAERVVNLVMRLGELAEEIVVTGGASAIELGTSALSHVVDARTIRELPLNGRDWTQLATLQPGVAVVRTQRLDLESMTQRGNGVQMTISGGRPSENNYRMNGVSINDYANTAPGSALGTNLGVDAVQEFSVLTSSYSAEYGRTSGGVINAVTRSGTNDLHGSVYYFHRNSALDARNFFDRGSSPPPFRRHQFGAAAGGAIRENSTFWFADYEGLRESLGITQLSVVPSPAARAGQLSTGTVTVDPVIQKVLSVFPLPNGRILPPGDTGEFSFAGQRVSREDFFTARLDHKFSDRDSLSGVYFFDQGDIRLPDEFNNKELANDSRRQAIIIEESHIFSPQLFNSFRLGVTRTSAANGLSLVVFNPILDDTSLGTVPGRALAIISVPGLTEFSGGLGAVEFNTFNYTSGQIYDDLFLTKGIHSLKFGFNAEHMWHNFNQTQDPNGNFNYGSLAAFLTNGRATSFSAMLPGTDGVRGIRQSIFGGYVQDDIRLRSNLTINLGLRYEMTTVPTEHHGRLATLRNLTDPEATVGRYFENSTFANFAPRIGFAWDPFGDGKTAIRGGFGIFDVLPLPYIFVSQFPRSTPFFKQGRVRNTPAGSFPKKVFDLLLPTTFRTTFNDPEPSRSYKMQWNINIQRELAGGVVVEIGYVGARGVHLPWRNNNVNTVIPTRTAEGYVYPPTATSVRINENFGVIRAVQFNADSFYQGLQFAVRKMLSRGFQAQASYTWGKSIDTASVTLSSNEFNNTVNNPVPFDTRVNRGLSDFDVRHNFVLNFVWDIPSPGAWSGMARWLASGWQLGGIYQASTGTPFSVGISGDVAGTKMGGDSAQRPILLLDPGCDDLTNPGNISGYIKTQCFAFPPAGVIGNIVGRNTLIGPGLSNLDFSLFKNNRVSRISENFNVQFRVEIYNALNRANFAIPSFRTIFDVRGNRVAAAGRITETETTSRLIQFGLKLIW